MKMVPASGAASRMFKDLFAFLNGKSEKPDNDFIRKFFEHIEDFAFFPRLNFVTLSQHGLSVDSLIREKRYKDVVRALIEKEGLNYGKLPKALLQFHKVDRHVAYRTRGASGRGRAVCRRQGWCRQGAFHRVRRPYASRKDEGRGGCRSSRPSVWRQV